MYTNDPAFVQSSRVGYPSSVDLVGLGQRRNRHLQLCLSFFVFHRVAGLTNLVHTHGWRSVQVERNYLAKKAREQGWREIVIYRKEHAAAGMIQRWTRGVLVRRRTPLVRTLKRRVAGGSVCSATRCCCDYCLTHNQPH